MAPVVCFFANCSVLANQSVLVRMWVLFTKDKKKKKVKPVNLRAAWFWQSLVDNTDFLFGFKSVSMTSGGITSQHQLASSSILWLSTKPTLFRIPAQTGDQQLSKESSRTLAPDRESQDATFITEILCLAVLSQPLLDFLDNTLEASLIHSPLIYIHYISYISLKNPDWQIHLLNCEPNMPPSLRLFLAGIWKRQYSYHKLHAATWVNVTNNAEGKG